MINFLVIKVMILVITVFVVLYMRKKAVTRLKSSFAYETALNIREKLQSEDFFVEDISIYYNFLTNKASGNFSLFLGDQKHFSDGIGDIWVNSSKSDHFFYENQTKSKIGYFYVVENEELGLCVSSKICTLEVPNFINIAAKCINESGHPFKHPKTYREKPETKQWLNVMFE